MKSWVSSAFGDLTSSAPLSSRTRSGRGGASTVNSPSLEKKPTLPKPSASQQQKSQENYPKQEETSKPKRVHEKHEHGLVEKYAPTTRSDLVVNKSKVEQLSSIIDDLMTRKKGSILLIEGPTGCGKTCALKTLCKEKNIDLVTWSNLSVTLGCIDTNLTGDNHDLDTHNESQLKLFQQFLFKSSRYESAQIFSTSSSQSSQPNRKLLLLVKEIPNAFYRDSARSQLASCLRQFVKYSKHSIVFVLTQTSYTSGDCNPNRLLTSDLRKELGVLELGFNAIANTFLMKHVERVAKGEGLGVDKAFLEGLCQVANGDIRNAVNTLEIVCVGKSDTTRKLPQLSQASAKKTTSRKRKQDPNPELIILDEEIPKESAASNQFENSSKNINYTIFRGLGKILHRKNANEAETSRDLVEAEKRLPAHLKQLGKQRPVLATNTDELAGKIPLSSDLLISYLFQNYLDMFKVKASNARVDFETTFDALESLTEHFMCADQVNRRVGLSELGCGSESKLREMASQIAMRSVLFNMWFGENESGSDDSKYKGQWLPLYKPFGAKVNETKVRREKIANELLMNAVAAEQSEFEFNYVDIKREFFTTYLPFIVIRSSKLAQNRQRPTTNNVAQLSNFISRSDYAFLTAKPKPANTKCSAQTNENDYVDDDDHQDELVSQPVPKQPPQVQQQFAVPTPVNTGQISSVKKGQYIYEDFTYLDIIDPSDRF